MKVPLRLNNRSRVKGDFYARICERLRGKFPGSTRFILGFTDEQDAKRVMEVLPKRFGKYKLSLHPDKTKFIDLYSKSGALIIENYSDICKNCRFQNFNRYEPVANKTW